MNRYFKTLMLAGTAFCMVFSSCRKDSLSEKSEQMGFEDPVLVIENTGYESKIIHQLEKPADHKFFTKGLIEYSLNGKLVASVDYGNGEKDAIATKTVYGKTEQVDLTHKGKKSDYDKIILTPLVKTNNCDFIVQGVIEYWQDGSWVATVDYGDGTCDEWATKTWNGGSKTFSLINKK